MGGHEEIVMDILGRLPVKSLLRFKCVSKFWNELISQPYFKKMHLNIHAKNQNPPQKFLIGQCDNMHTTLSLYSFSLSNSAPQLVKDIRRLDSPSSFEPKWGRVYCCWDGLFFIGIWGELDEAIYPGILFLWNPSTGESVKLPTQYPQSPLDQYLYGLGYDPTTDDYKIIRVDGDKDTHDEILALKSGSWRKIGEYAGGINGIRWTRPSQLCLAFAEGAFHWVGLKKHCVVSFNISNEMYGEIPLPVTSFSNRIGEQSVSAVGGRLYYHHDDGITFNLWVMKDYGRKESWTKWMSIPCLGECILAPIHRFSNDEVLLRYRPLEGSIYKTSNGSSNRTWPRHCNDIIDLRRITDCLVYTESLISPKLVDPQETAVPLVEQTDNAIDYNKIGGLAQELREQDEEISQLKHRLKELKRQISRYRPYNIPIPQTPAYPWPLVQGTVQATGETSRHKGKALVITNAFYNMPIPHPQNGMPPPQAPATTNDFYNMPIPHPPPPQAPATTNASYNMHIPHPYNGMPPPQASATTNDFYNMSMPHPPPPQAPAITNAFYNMPIPHPYYGMPPPQPDASIQTRITTPPPQNLSTSTPYNPWMPPPPALISYPNIQIPNPYFRLPPPPPQGSFYGQPYRQPAYAENIRPHPQQQLPKGNNGDPAQNQQL